MRFGGLLILLGGICAGHAADVTVGTLARPAVYTGLCDASAAVAVSSNLFLVANDEDNALRLYRVGQGGPVLRRFDLTRFLEVERKSPEVDIEGAAAIGNRVFWIGSHGRNRRGKEALNRSRLFATDIRQVGQDVSVTPVGRPCKTLLEAMLSEPRFAPFHLRAASGLVPKDEDALNIEGLAATPEGHLLIGFRNPIPEGKALLIRLLNPNDIVVGGAAPRFGEAIQLDLGGLGIRDIAYRDGVFTIIAGAYHSGGSFALCRWAGDESKPERLTTESFAGLNPEAIVFFPDRPAPLILSDDGTVRKGGVPCKELKRETLRSFRAFSLTLN